MMDQSYLPPGNGRFIYDNGTVQFRIGQFVNYKGWGDEYYGYIWSLRDGGKVIIASPVNKGHRLNSLFPNAPDDLYYWESFPVNLEHMTRGDVMSKMQRFLSFNAANAPAPTPLPIQEKHKMGLDGETIDMDAYREFMKGL